MSQAMTEDETTDVEPGMRESRRIPLDAAVVVSWTGSRGSCKARNISAGGLFVLASEAPPIGSEISVEFALGGLEIRGTGVVIRDDTQAQAGECRGFAIAFLDMPKVQRSHLMRLTTLRTS